MKKILATVVFMMACGSCAYPVTMVDFGPYTTELFAERPYLTEKVKPVEQGIFELKAGYDAELSRKDILTQGARLHVNYGVTKDMTFGICLPYGGDYTGVNNAQLGVKYSLNGFVKALFAEKSPFDASMTFSLVPGNMDYALKLIMGKDWGKFRMYANAGYVKHWYDKTSILYGAAFTALVGRRLDIGGEVFGEVERAAKGFNITVNATGCVKYWFSDFVNLDFGVGAGILNDPKIYATAGFTWYTKE